VRAGLEDVGALAAIVSKRREELVLAPWMLVGDKIAETIALWIAHPRREIRLGYHAGDLAGFIALERSGHGLDRHQPLSKIRYLFSVSGAHPRAAQSLLRSVIDAEHQANQDLIVSFFGGSAPHKSYDLARQLGLELAGTQCLRLLVGPPRQRGESSLVRRATESDADQIAELCKAFFRESNRSARLIETTIDFQGKALSAIDDARQVVFVARHHGQAVGFISGAVKRIRGTWLRVLKNSYWYVAPAARGTYAAPALLGAFEAYGLGNDADAVAIGTSAGIHTNRTRAFLQRLGYRHVGDTYLASRSSR